MFDSVDVYINKYFQRKYLFRTYNEINMFIRKLIGSVMLIYDVHYIQSIFMAVQKFLLHHLLNPCPFLLHRLFVLHLLL